MSISDEIHARIQEIADSKLNAERYDAEGNLVCYYCGNPIGRYTTHRDHITPKSRGGVNDFWNIALTCANCNLRKSIMHPFLIFGSIADDLQIDYVARILLGGAAAARRFSPADSQVVDSSVANIADKLAALSEQLQQVTKWMHMLEQEVETLATTRKNQLDQNEV